MKATLKIYRGGVQLPAATLVLTDAGAGYQGACVFDYTLDYAVDWAGPDTAHAAGLSCRFLADFQQYRLDQCPALPSMARVSRTYAGGQGVEQAGHPNWHRVIALFPDRAGQLTEALRKFGRPFGYSVGFVPARQ